MAQYIPHESGAIPLIAALAANSYFIYGNIGCATTGVLPYIRGRFSPYEILRGTNWFIERGKVTLFASNGVSSPLFACAAYFAQDLRVRQLCTVAAVSALAIVPYTVIVMLPTNKALAEMESGGPEAMKGKEGKVLTKVEKWRAQHLVRDSLGVVAWIAGILALSIL